MKYYALIKILTIQNEHEKRRYDRKQLLRSITFTSDAYEIYILYEWFWWKLFHGRRAHQLKCARLFVRWLSFRRNASANKSQEENIKISSKSHKLGMWKGHTISCMLAHQNSGKIFLSVCQSINTNNEQNSYFNLVLRLVQTILVRNLRTNKRTNEWTRCH